MRERKAREEAEKIAFNALERSSIQAQQLRRHSAELEAALRASREAEKARKELVNAAAHVLRTPMTSLLIRLHTVTLLLDGKQKDAVAKALRSASSLNAVLNDLVRVSQLDAGAIEVELEPVDLARWAEHHPKLEATWTDGVDFTTICDAKRLDDIVSTILRMEGDPETIRVRAQQDDHRTRMRFMAPSGGPSVDEMEALGLGTYLAHGVAEAIGGSLERGVDPLGRSYWDLSFPAAREPP